MIVPELALIATTPLLLPPAKSIAVAVPLFDQYRLPFGKLVVVTVQVQVVVSVAKN